MSYDTFQSTDAGALIFFILVSLILTLASYCAIPLLIAKLRKTPIAAKKYRRTCFLSNFAVCVVWMAINGTSSGAPYLLWTWVFSHVGTNILRNRNLLIEEKTLAPAKNHTPTADNPEKLTLTPEMYKYICGNCRSLFTAWSNECPNCKTVGTIRQGTDEAIRKWNNLLDASEAKKPVAELNASVPDAPTSAPKSSPSVNAAPTYCSNCGERLLKEWKFCQNCGTKVTF